MRKENLEDKLYRKILGCLEHGRYRRYLGMPCHDMTIDEIQARFQGPVTTFKAPFEDTRVHQGFEAGRVTDDTVSDPCRGPNLCGK